MHEDLARARLAAVPESIKQSLLADRKTLPAGALASVARFFKVLADRSERAETPSRSSFETACANESALALLLRVLDAHAPTVCLAEGRALRRDYYRARSSGPGASGLAPKACAETAPRGWPENWLKLLPGLRAAPIKPSSLNRYVASVNRCADMLPNLKCPPRLGWLLAWELGQEACRVDSVAQKKAVNARTVAAYLRALASLGLHGGLDADALGGIRAVEAHFIRKARRLPKQKEDRIQAFYESGGYHQIVQAIRDKLDEADAQPAWSAKAEVARATAALLAVCVNVPARTGDVAAWTFGKDLIREPNGTWQLRWRQEKTGNYSGAGELWGEVAQVLDVHILGGRPERQAAQRFEELRGLNWLNFTATAYASRWPSEQAFAAIGLPLHDLRTLVADYLRLHDTVSAPQILAVVLGHVSQDAGKDYRALATETAAQKGWHDLRARHAAGLKPVAGTAG